MEMSTVLQALLDKCLQLRQAQFELQTGGGFAILCLVVQLQRLTWRAALPMILHPVLGQEIEESAQLIEHEE
jgi:hypothetical protein